MKKLSSNFEENLLTIFLGYFVIVTFLQVFMRYVVGYSLSWSEESIRFIFIWMVLFGTSLGVKHNKHVSILMLFNRLSVKGQIVMKIIANTIILIYSLILVVQGIKVVFGFFEFPQASPALGIPMQFIYAACPVGFSFTAFYLIQSIIYELGRFRRLED